MTFEEKMIDIKKQSDKCKALAVELEACNIKLRNSFNTYFDLDLTKPSEILHIIEKVAKSIKKELSIKE